MFGSTLLYSSSRLNTRLPTIRVCSILLFFLPVYSARSTLFCYARLHSILFRYARLCAARSARLGSTLGFPLRSIPLYSGLFGSFTCRGLGFGD